MNIQQLQNGSIEAWTWLLRQQANMSSDTVIGVQMEPLEYRATRFSLTLAEYSEPLSVIGFETNQTESTFYSRFAAGLNQLPPKSWYEWQNRDGGWVVIEENGPYHSPSTWSREDLDRVTEKLAGLHATWWGSDELNNIELPEHPVVQSFDFVAMANSIGKARHDHQKSPIFPQHVGNKNSLLSATSAQGSVIPELMIASVGFKMLKKLGGWPDLIEGIHMSALEHLLQRPEIMLKPLQHVPLTLLHGQPVSDNWRINLMDETHLANWRNVSIGPAVCDLAIFIENYIFWQTSHPDLHRLVPGSLEEMLIDSYLMHLSENVSLEGEKRPGSSRHIRRYALPAAICWHTISHWLPTFVTWFGKMPQSRHSWEIADELSPESIAAWGINDLNQYRPAIGAIFERFLDAYKLLVNE
ncbi:MAG: hypothetical protein ACI85U_000993 [Candidatus Promineifilaceae bacterium]|jgi:hypothetical protein